MSPCHHNCILRNIQKINKGQLYDLKWPKQSARGSWGPMSPRACPTPQNHGKDPNYKWKTMQKTNPSPPPHLLHWKQLRRLLPRRRSPFRTNTKIPPKLPRHQIEIYIGPWQGPENPHPMDKETTHWKECEQSFQHRLSMPLTNTFSTPIIYVKIAHISAHLNALTRNICHLCMTGGVGKLNFYSRAAIILYLIPLPPYAKCQMRFWKAIMFCPLHSTRVFWVIAKVFQCCRSHIMYCGTFWLFFSCF